MLIWNASLATAAAALAFVPAVASAQSADRAAPAVSQDENMEGSGVIIAVLAVAAVIAGIIVAVDGGDDAPVSA